MEVFSHEEGDVRAFSLKGRLEFGDYPDASLVTEAFESSKINQVVIDLSELVFMDSAGVGLLIGLNKAAEERGTRMTLRGATGAVKELIDLFQLDTVFDVQ